jgi:PAS domain S-box-containing protein
MRLRKLSFKIKLIFFVEILVILTLALVGFFVWSELDMKVREISRTKLISIASTSASLIDVSKHESIQTEEDANTRNYQDIKEILKKIKEANVDVDDIYTLRKTGKENIWQFVMTASNDEDKNSNGQIDENEIMPKVGDEYDVSTFPEMQKGFDSAIADKGTSCDKWGCWLSGYAPLRDKNGITVAEVGVDMKADDLVAYEKKATRFFAIAYLLLLTIIPVIIYWMLSHFIRPLSIIDQGIRKFGRNFSSRINIKTGDEFESIAQTFNHMAKELQNLYQNLDKKVKEKTKGLAMRMKEIEESKAKDEAVLAGIGEGLIVTDHSGKIIIVNSSAEKILGIPKEKMINRRCMDISVEDEKGNVINSEKRPIHLAMITGKNITGVYYFAKSKEKKIPIAVTAAPITFRKHNIGAVMIFKDITKDREIDIAKTEFVSLASHQLRTPLSSINWQVETLLDGDAGKMTRVQQKYLKKVSMSTKRMVELVNALLNVSRIETGTFVIDAKLVRLEKILGSVLGELTHKISGKEITVIKNIDKVLPPIKADPNLIRIIFQNLLTNAIKYTPSGGKVQIKIHLEKSKGSSRSGLVAISVSDNGYGIPQNQQDKIFTKLFRADNIKSKVTEGNGLGLYIVKSIVDVSGGRIEFHSKVGKGTIFKVVFPLSGMKEKRGTKLLN